MLCCCVCGFIVVCVVFCLVLLRVVFVLWWCVCVVLFCCVCLVFLSLCVLVCVVVVWCGVRGVCVGLW